MVPVAAVWDRQVRWCGWKAELQGRSSTLGIHNAFLLLLAILLSANPRGHFTPPWFQVLKVGVFQNSRGDSQSPPLNFPSLSVLTQE
jgi:hypothetical protein